MSCVSSYDILGIFHFPARSSVVTFQPLLKKLVEDGHNVTILTNHALKGIRGNYREIQLGGASAAQKFGSFDDFSDGRWDSYMCARDIGIISKKLCKLIFSIKDVQDLYNSHFDLVIVQIFQTECIYQIAKKFDCPIIGVHSTNIMPWSGGRFALPNNPSYIQNSLLPFPAKMNFWQRLENSLVTLGHIVYYHHVMVETDKRIVEEHFNSEEASLMNTIGYNTSLFLVNTHFTVNSPRPLVPNVIEIGGIHIGQSRPLSKVLLYYF